MQLLRDQRKFCQGKEKSLFSIESNLYFFYSARELINDNEIHRLAEKYHHRHPIFTIDIQERTCRSITLACVYYYRHIEVDLRCQCVYNDSLQKFESIWSTDHVKYQEILHEIFSRLNSSLINRSLDDQIETIIEQITKYFIRLKPIQEEEQQSSTKIPRRDSTVLSLPIEIIQYERSPQSRRNQCLGRSLSWSQSCTIRSIHHSNSVEESV